MRVLEKDHALALILETAMVVAPALILVPGLILEVVKGLVSAVSLVPVTALVKDLCLAPARVLARKHLVVIVMDAARNLNPVFNGEKTRTKLILADF